MHCLLSTLLQVVVLLNFPLPCNNSLFSSASFLHFPYFSLSLSPTFLSKPFQLLHLAQGHNQCHMFWIFVTAVSHLQVSKFILVTIVVLKIASKLSGLNQPFYFAHNFMHQKFEKGSAEQFSLEVTHAVAVRCQLGLQTSDDFTGLDVQDDSLIRLGVDAGCPL